AAVIIEAPIALEPAALERSALRLEPVPPEAAPGARAAGGDGDTVLPGEADRFLTEVPLEDLDLPARLLVLARVEPETLGHLHEPVRPADMLALDLVLA